MKLILIGFATLVMTLGGFGTTSPPTEPSTSEPTVTTGTLPSVFISDIEVPYEVVMYVQDTYQGLAVISVEKTSRGGQEVYRLRVDRDDNPTSYEESFYLLYTLDWKLIGDEKALPPPPPLPQPTPEPEPQPATEPAPQPEPEGGRGGGMPPPEEDTGGGEENPNQDGGGGDEEQPPHAEETPTAPTN